MSIATPTYRPPDWRPLERALAAEFGTAAVDARGAFWFIGFVDGPADVGELRVYEHSATRRRLVLDTDGDAYAWAGGAECYHRVLRCEALVAVLV